MKLRKEILENEDPEKTTDIVKKGKEYRLDLAH